MNGHIKLSRDQPVEISVVCPVGKHVLDLQTVHHEFHEVLARSGRMAEFIYVVDGPWTGAEGVLKKLRDDRFPIRVFNTARGFGEATALQYGFEKARGRYVLTIPDRPQIDAAALVEILNRLDQGADVVVTRREPRTDPWFNQLQSRVFHGLVRRLVRSSFNDLSCGLRGFSLEAAHRLQLYGDQHRFIPVIAAKVGYRVIEIPGKQHPMNEALRVRVPGVYARRLLDILNIYFLSRFTRKPLRFFGLIGLTVGAVGFVISAYLATLRLLGLSGLANRPLLLLGVLLIVLGVQVMSIGLLGEIIIFLSPKREIPEVTEVILQGEDASSSPERRTAHEDAG